MSFKVNGYNIFLTRGDSAALVFNLTDEETGETRKLEEGDRVVLTVKKSAEDSTSVFQRELGEDGVFAIKPGDTASAAFGDYIYDVQLTTAGGDVYTVIDPENYDTTFTIGEEVS